MITATQVKEAWAEANRTLSVLERAQEEYIKAYNRAAKLDDKWNEQEKKKEDK